MVSKPDNFLLGMCRFVSEAMASTFHQFEPCKAVGLWMRIDKMIGKEMRRNHKP